MTTGKMMEVDGADASLLQWDAGGMKDPKLTPWLEVRARSNTEGTRQKIAAASSAHLSTNFISATGYRSLAKNDVTMYHKSYRERLPSKFGSL